MKQQAQLITSLVAVATAAEGASLGVDTRPVHPGSPGEASGRRSRDYRVLLHVDRLAKTT